MFKWSEEQEEVLNGAGNMLVSASAGSGKTAVMVEKVIRLIEEGKDLRRILLMTFTRAAANEMREKLVRKMYEVIQKTNSVNMRKQLVNLPFSHIETIDGFCFYIMRKYFNIAGCDPSVSVGDTAQMSVSESECLDRIIERFFESGDDDFIKTADYFREKRSYDKFKKVILTIKGFASTRPNKDEFYDKCINGDPEATEEYYLSAKKTIIPYYLDELKNLIDDCLECNYELNIPLYRGAYELLDNALSANSVDEFFQNVLRVTMPNKINKKAVENGLIYESTELLSKKASDGIKKFANECKDEFELYKNKDIGRQYVIRKKLVEVSRVLEEEYGNYKKRRNLIDINDAIFYTLKVLGNETARKEIAESFDYIFIDEYQDTNYLQETLLNGIGRGNVFSVGDAKQAIYHFRAAEPKIFIDRGSFYESGENGKNYYMNTNYRSCEEIIDFTNRVCDRIMLKEFCNIDYKNSSRLNYGNKIKNVAGDAVKIYVKKKENTEKEEAKGVYSVKSALSEEENIYESDFIASKILSIIGTPLDAEDKNRTIDFGDIAILLRSGSHFNPIIKSLKKYGIPYYALKDTGNVFPERELIVNCLRVVLNADDDISLYSVCASPIGEFTVSDMLTLRGQTNDNCVKKSLWETLNQYTGDKIIENKIKVFVEFLENMRMKSAFYTASELLDEILGYKYDIYLTGHNPEVLSELNGFIYYVSGLGSNESAESFLEFYDTSYKGNVPPSKENAVAIMTMHGSKGLEFPVVFLPFQDKQPSGFGTGIELDGDLGLAVKSFSDEDRTVKDTFESKVLRMKCKDEDRQERARLMYVAFTRAKNYLYITGGTVTAPENVFEGGSVMQWILLAAESDAKIQNLIEEMPMPDEIPDNETEIVDKEFDAKGLEERYKYENDAKQPAKYSVSEILQKEEGYGANPFVYESNSEAIALGVAVHTVMQHIDYSLETEEEIKVAVEKLRREGRLTDEEAAVVPVDKILRTLKSKVIREGMKYKTKREQPFIMYVPVEEGGEKILVQGVIDLLIDKGNSFVVVDFKTGRQNAAKLKERYTKQLELYAEGVEKILKKPVSEKIIYGVMTDTIVSFR